MEPIHLMRRDYALGRFGCVNGGVDRERKWSVKREGEVEMALEAAPSKVINNIGTFLIALGYAHTIFLI